MLILLFIFALVRHLQGAPTAIPSLPGCDSPDIFIRDDPTNTHLGTRGVNDIVISCLATIFACTWTAIHPNIPSPCDSGWEIFKRQVTTMIYAILAPEAITIWALGQHLAARKIAKLYNEEIAKIQVVPQNDSFVKMFIEGVKGWFRRKPPPQLAKEGDAVPWTITHGFFVQMGGFLMCEDGKPTQTLEYGRLHGSELKNLKYQVECGHIDAPRITEAEIEDRSKGDGLAKTIVVLQTTWFIAQCIVRWSSSLHVTELEVLTLGFAMLNGITYALWWHKPQSVRLPVYLEMKERVGGNATEQPDEVVEGRESKVQDESTGTPTAAAPVKEEAPPAKRSYLRVKLEEDSAWATRWELIWRMPYRLGQAVLRPISRMMVAAPTYVTEGDLRVPMFHSGRIGSGEADSVRFASSAIASIFGLIHLIPAWFLDFPSRPEMLLWRVSAGIITMQPFLLGVVRFLSRYRTTYKIVKPLGLVAVLGLPLYIIARLTLIILAFLSLRTVHSDALVTVDWLSFIPHF